MGSIFKELKKDSAVKKTHPIWDSVISKLKETNTEEQVKIFIEPIEIVEFNEVDKKIGLLIPNESFETLLNMLFKEQIVKAIKFVTGFDYQITFSYKKANIEESKAQEIKIETSNLEQNQSFVSENKGLNLKRNNLMSKFTLENYGVGASNDYAYKVASSISELTGRIYNPFYLYSGPGLGKTHLLHAIGNKMATKSPSTKINYISAENFTNEFSQASATNTFNEFRRKYRENTNVLLFDDIQFLIAKPRIQEEFLHTFTELYNSGQQIIITGNKRPRDLDGIDERIISRIEGGLCQEIVMPEYETRLQIIKKKAESADIHLSKEVASVIAENIKTNVREIEGCLLKLSAHMSLTGSECTVEFAKTALRDLFSKEKKENYTTDEIINAVCKNFSIKLVDLKSKSRSKNIAEPRQIAMYLLRKFSKKSFPEIGAIFGGKDHSTVMHSVNKIESLLEKNNENIKNLVDKVVKSL